jgi:hypothetical protein
MRPRHMCYGVPKHEKKHPQVPKLSCGRSMEGVTAHLEEVCKYIAGEPPLKLKLATAGSSLPNTDRPLDEISQGIEDDYRVEMDRLRER